MQFLWMVLLMLTPLKSFALEVITTVQGVDFSERPHEPALVFLGSGHVGKIAISDELVRSLSEAKNAQHKLKVMMNEDREITAVEFIGMGEVSGPRPVEKNVPVAELPSVLNSMGLARQLFANVRHKEKESQCFNRAHVWSYEWKKNNLNTSKMFIFFSARYIRETNFHWWFHVAPYVHVVIGSEIKERVMDRKYLKRPASVQDWIEAFMEKGARCRTAKVYTDYANYPEADGCYLMRSGMYTYWPLDLEMEELNGTKKVTWVADEIKAAYADALDINN